MRAAIALLALSCSSGDDISIDYSVKFTDATNHDQGNAVMPGNFKTLTPPMQSTPLTASMATFEIRSDMGGLHFSVLEGPMRRGAISCIAGKGTGVQSANADVSTGGHYLITLAYKGVVCTPEQ